MGTLIRKDARLLRNYLRSAVLATIACYVASALIVLWLKRQQSDELQSTALQLLIVLRGGSQMGLPTTGFLAALLAGSVFTLERSDRSAEFLACLPPTRMQHLASKLTILLGAIAAMIAVHLLALALASQLAKYVPSNSGPMAGVLGAPNTLTRLTMVAVIVEIIGGALAVSAWLRANGVPILCGLLTPVLISATFLTIERLRAVPDDLHTVQVRFIVTSFVLGTLLALSGCWAFVTRNEP